MKPYFECPPIYNPIITSERSNSLEIKNAAPKPKNKKKKLKERKNQCNSDACLLTGLKFGSTLKFW